MTDDTITELLTTRPAVYLRRKDTGRQCLLTEGTGATEWAISVSVDSEGNPEPGPVVFLVTDEDGDLLWEGTL
jgi:hypothetical protein